MPELPSPLRAALGLAVTLVDEARHLPDKAIELPMMAVSRALQLSLRAQQQYAALEARGDQLLAGTRITDEPPAWAQFDEPVTPRSARSSAFDLTDDDLDDDDTDLDDDLDGDR